MKAFFFDTSALVSRYCADNATNRINRILAKGDSQFYISELTLIEMSSSLAQIRRRQHLGVAEFQRMRNLFEDDIASGLLRVRTITQGDLLNARDLLEDAAVLKNCDLRSADAIIAASCRELAHALKSRICFYTKDWKQYSSVYHVYAYRSALKLRFIGKGKGGIPARSG